MSPRPQNSGELQFSEASRYRAEDDNIETSQTSAGWEHIPLIAWNVPFAIAKDMKQSGGIKINAVISALGAAPNQDNSRRRASRKKTQILITLLHLHSS